MLPEAMGEFLSHSWKFIAPLVAGVMTILLIPKDRRTPFGISELIKEVFRTKRSAPTDSGDYKPRVLISMLLGDRDGKARDDLYEALSNDDCGNMFDVEFSGRSFASRSAHQKKARALGHHLRSRNADVIVHGQFDAEKHRYFLSFYGSPGARRQHLSAQLTDDLEIDRERIKELSSVIAARVLETLPDGVAQGGFYVADQLTPLMPKLRHVITTVDPDNTHARISYRAALGRLAEQSGQSHWLEERLAFEQREDRTGRGKYADTWQERGSSLFSRGNALKGKGERGDDQALEDAIAAYRLALGEWTRERIPLDWAMTQNNLGEGLRIKGERGDDEALEDAINAYRDALQEMTRDRVPLQWAMTQNNLGNALQVKGERGDDEALEDAINAYRDALQEMTRDRVPLQWAM
ncbi:MAG: hypothetical protein AAFX52_08270, partial [Pseudomonadota bacterium]